MKFDIRPLSQKWFAESTPQNYKSASATLGSGDNGTITINALGVESDAVISVAIASGANENLSVVYSEGEIIVTLGTGASAGVVSNAKNTAILIATAINKLEDFSAVASGTGATAISTATETDVTFTSGQLGTPCAEAYIGFINGSTYYVCTKADNSTKNNGWRSFSLTNY